MTRNDGLGTTVGTTRCLLPTAQTVLRVAHEVVFDYLLEARYGTLCPFTDDRSLVVEPLLGLRQSPLAPTGGRPRPGSRNESSEEDVADAVFGEPLRSEEHTSELQS